MSSAAKYKTITHTPIALNLGSKWSLMGLLGFTLVWVWIGLTQLVTNWVFHGIIWEKYFGYLKFGSLMVNGRPAPIIIFQSYIYIISNSYIILHGYHRKSLIKIYIDLFIDICAYIYIYIKL